MGQTIEDLKQEEVIKQQSELETFGHRADNMSSNQSGTNIVVQEEVKEEIAKITKEDLITIFSGVRPPHVNFVMYKSIQKYFATMNKKRKEGTMLFVSNGFAVKDKDDKEVIKYLPKGLTYKKNK